MRFKKRPQLPGAGRTRAGHHHGSHTPTSPEAVLLGKMTPNISVPSVGILDLERVGQSVLTETIVIF